MLPRRTFSATSRTAKNPANSFVNPWVSRINSSAKQISPCPATDRAWLFFVTGRFCQERLENRPHRLLRGGLSRQYPALAKVQAYAFPVPRGPTYTHRP